MYAILGDIKFEGYKGFQDFTASNETVLSEHPVIEGKPRLQMTGEKLEEISLKFLLHSSFCNPEKEVETLQGYRRTGQVVPFVAGDGSNFGDYVVKSIGRTYTQTDNSGAIIGIELDIVLTEVYNPGQKPRPANEKLAVKLPAVSVAPLLPKPTDPQQLAKQIRNVNIQSAAMDKELKDAQRIPSRSERALRTARKRINIIRDSLKEIERIGSNTRDVIVMYDEMKGQADAVKSQTEALANFVEDGDINSAVNASAGLRNSYSKLAIDSAPINNLVGVRRDKENPNLGSGTRFNFEFDGRF